MSINRPQASLPRAVDQQSGVALVVTLAILVLLSGIILAFFSQSALRRQIAYSSSGQNRAQILSRSALDTIMGDLQGEIAAGSSADAKYTVNNISIYVPTSNQTVVPCRVTGTADTTGSAFCNLVKISLGGTNAWSGTPYATAGPIRAAVDGSTYLTTTPSLDGRHIPDTTWSKSALTSGTIPTPSWILMTRSGAVPDATNLPSIAAMANRADLSNTNCVIGRYAYAIYDVGGLIDVNIAGNNLDTIDSSANARRGRLHQAALGQIPLTGSSSSLAANTQAASTLISWRSPHSTTTTGTNWLFSSTNTFISVSGSGDQAFLSRQDLIAYSKNNPGVLSPDALPYLTVFTRELNQPGFEPDPNRSKVQSASTTWQWTPPSGGSSITGAYGVGNPNTYNADSRYNPSLVNVRDSDGKAFIKQRFPLGRLAWITSTGPGIDPLTGTTATDDDIHTYFGLVWNQSKHRWDYTSPDSNQPTSAILTLDAIPTNRTHGPDFFELLQAAIHVGSLGRDAGPVNAMDYTNAVSNGHPDRAATSFVTGYLGVESNVMLADQNVSRHILQIGANIIDQARTDDFPTALSMNGAGTVYGIKNLPYPTRIINIPVTNYSTEAAAQLGKFYLCAEVWNPHDQKNVTSGSRPINFRFRPCADPDDPAANGTIYLQPSYAEVFPSNSKSPAYYGPQCVIGCQDPGNIIQFSSTTVPATIPTLLKDSNSSGGATSTIAWYPGGNRSNLKTDTIRGIPAGQVDLSLAQWNTYKTDGLSFYLTYSNSTQLVMIGSIIYPSSGATNFVFEYQNGSNWYPYSVIRNVEYRGQSIAPCANDSTFLSSNPNDSAFNKGWVYSEIHLDPRTDRFGMMGRLCEMGSGGRDYDPVAGQTLWHSTASLNTSSWNWNGIGSFIPRSPAFHLQTPSIQIGTAAFSSPVSKSTQSSGIWLESIGDNLTSSYNYYQDPDGVVRAGEGAYQSGNNDGRPMAMDSAGTGMVATSQPVILDRPFRSVGELGYVFRDLPWRNLDFFTTNSGDGALLEAFSIDDTSPQVTAGVSPVVAGKVNLNTRNSLSLKALLAGAIMTDACTGTPQVISATDAATIAQALINRTSNSTDAAKGPLISKADLVTKFSGDLVYASSSDRIIKPRREAAIRALADAGNVRTWNLLIDVVVQAGRYPIQAKTADKFLVEGERHYWMHVAIDRFTGKIIDQFLEPVYD
ncbi:MAG: hypothetical protein ACFUZC_15850 [Chthoniobacteraceae bacterium]